MALTKVTGQVIKNTTDVTVGVLTVTNTLAVGGTVSIGGTLTYEDVTNVDAVGLITARDGIKVGSGITLSVDGDGFFTGVITATSYSGIDLSDVTGATGDFSIADKIIHTGDTNTAIRFPAADTITAETDGSERARIDSTGRVRIGCTAQPSTTVSGAQFDAGGKTLRISEGGGTSSTTGASVQITGGGSNTNIGAAAAMGAVLSLTNCNNTDNNQTSIDFSASSGLSVAKVIGKNDSHSSRNGSLIFATSSAAAPAERARIDSSGRLLIGATSSRGVAGGQSRVQIENTSTEGLSVVRTSNDNGTSLIAIGKTRNGAIVQDDDVVGTLGFYGDDGNDLDRPTAEIRSAVDGTPGADDMPGRLEFKTTADGSSTTTERMRIDSSGRVMIGSGTYIGGAALAVLGTGNTPNAYGSLAIAKVGANPTSGTTLANIRLNGGSVGTGRGAEINAIADANWSDGSSHPTYLTFSTVASSSTSATERIRVHSGGNVDIKTGNLVISTAGKGIDFSNASPSGSNPSHNILDDYEEGTWTLGVAHDAITSEEGRYTKIGRMVFATFEITFGSSSNGSHQYITGLPFTSQANSDNGGNCGGVARDYQNYDIENGPIYHIQQNGTAIYFYKNNGQVMAASNTSGYNFRGTAIYHAA